MIFNGVRKLMGCRNRALDCRERSDTKTANSYAAITCHRQISTISRELMVQSWDPPHKL
jgi:hypothetical protein